MSVAAKPRSTPRPDRVKVTTALLSVSDKSGLIELAKALSAAGVKLLSTGGTSKAIREAGLEVTDVSDHTGFPEIMDGRVKTLHPKVHGGLLARRDDTDHANAMKEQGIETIDLLVVNLYPFRETVAKGANYDNCVENIDIGGPAMLRAAAKNHDFVTVVTDPSDYTAVAEEIASGGTTFKTRQRLAAKTYAATASYDAAISAWFAKELDESFPQTLSVSATKIDTLRYGENPHQLAAVYADGSGRAGVVTAKQLQGKELSYNNLNDTDAAFELVSEFDSPAVAIIKHANPCGVATGADMISAYKDALACDPVSAFGGIIALNRKLDGATAEEIIKIFSEVIIAPEISDEAKAILAAKKNVRVLETGGMADPKQARMTLKTISGGWLLQTADNGHITEADLKVVTKRAPTEQELKDLLFAFRVCKHVKSNAIIYAKGGKTVGIGAGQMSRIDSSRIAAWKAKEAGTEIEGSVVASDAFFPFPDGLLAAADAGATAVIQPGGSIKDDDVIKAADERGLAMVLTGMRHFRH
ncbi:MAG: bifunctional phosphoribosylaminoimidazolecarboxamide formyltransferase/IMP cyclohydrolase [Pseudobdellovibrionaceae bacterium]|jgi:phosphoribosylaminoimidazolecarboxamide formyltransferase/IMP cyclohydrolase|nr:bifunctional phosphoribosylaminoimidazolecarboxamide formyltransferase/IMP cyclohydrolase [Pseudobdellovibrionaceae bacterium]